ncbi:MAG: DUF5655 domain-containing protein [Candidatus Aminicenantes bacterium]|jgi:predicted transport protein
MQTVLYHNNVRYTENSFNKENDFEQLLINNSKILFGKYTIIIDSKKKIDSQFMGGAIPDCFLFDLSDPQNPEFYIVEVELSKHNFYNHIFPQITKFFAFFKNQSSQNDLIEKLHSIIVADNDLKKEFQSRIGSEELYKYIKDMIENSQNILLVIDGEKKELPEIINTYTDTWGKIVKVTIVKEYTSEGGSILSISPDFENIEIVDITSDDDKPDVQGRYTEEFHLERVNPDIKEIYSLIKTGLSEAIPGLIFNPQRYYISLKKKKNFAYIKLRKKKIRIVVTLGIEKVKERIHHHYINTLSDAVQNYYNSPSCEIVIENKDHLTEVIELLKDIKKLKTGSKKEAVQDAPKTDIPTREMKKPRGLDNLKKIIDGFDS